MKIFSFEKLVESTYRITLDLNLSYSFLNKFVIGCAHWPNTDSNLYQVPGLGKKIILALRRFSTTFTIFQNRVVIHTMQCGSLLVESVYYLSFGWAFKLKWNLDNCTEVGSRALPDITYQIVLFLNDCSVFFSSVDNR